MEAHYRAFNGRLVIKVEGTTIKDLFKQIGPVAEVLDGDSACGKCSSPNIYPRVREAQGYDFYELVCSDCSAKLSFGQHKDGGTMWPKRADDNGNTLDHRGWKLYQALPAAQSAASAPRPTQPASAQLPAPPNPRVDALIARCSNGVTAQVFGEVCSALEQFILPSEVDGLWLVLTGRHGDPVKTPAAIRPVMTELVKELERGEASKAKKTA